MRQRESTMLSILSAFVVGGLIGAGVALLMAPMSGEETRSMIQKKSMEMKDRAVDSAQDTRDRAGKMITGIASQTKDRASSIASQTKDKASSLRKRSRVMAECE